MSVIICYQDQREVIHDCDLKLAGRLFEQIQKYPENAGIAIQMKRTSVSTEVEGKVVFSQEFHFPTIESRDSFLSLVYIKKGSSNDYNQVKPNEKIKPIDVAPKTETKRGVTSLKTSEPESKQGRRSGVQTLGALRNEPLNTISIGHRLGGNVNSTTSMRERVLKATEERMKSQTAKSETSVHKPK